MMLAILQPLCKGAEVHALPRHPASAPLTIASHSCGPPGVNTPTKSPYLACILLSSRMYYSSLNKISILFGDVFEKTML